MPLTDEQKKSIAAELNGTCKSGHDLEEEYGVEADEIEAAAAEEELFRCAQCDWWCEINEAHDRDGEDVCDDCYGETED
jgi:formylmethanofuran dehydrogenase subunit E